VRVESEEGKALAEGSCSPSSLAPSPSCSFGGCGWLEAAFKAPLTLQGGKAYRLVLAASPKGRFEAFPMRKGSDKGFTNTTLFADGHAEFNDGGGWKGWEQWGQQNRRDSDLQFFFRLAN